MTGRSQVEIDEMVQENRSQTTDLREAITEALTERWVVVGEDTDREMAIESVSSFDDVGMLTLDDGLVVRLSDGSEFQLTIVRSR